MTPKQLLQPRYEVIADYPNSPFKVGEILNFKEIYPFSGLSFDIPHLGIVAPEYFDKYPHLFRRLEWWEKRKPEDMPEYVKHKTGAYYKVFVWITNNYCKILNNTNTIKVESEDIKPATFQDYTDYLTKTK